MEDERKFLFYFVIWRGERTIVTRVRTFTIKDCKISYRTDKIDVCAMGLTYYVTVLFGTGHTSDR